MTVRIGAALALLLAGLVVAVAPGVVGAQPAAVVEAFDAAADPERVPRVRSVRLPRTRGRADSADRVAVEALEGAAAEPAALEAFVAALERPERGGVGLVMRPVRGDAALVDVTVRFEPAPRRTGRLSPLVADAPPDPDESRRLVRRVESVVSPFALEEGHIFHPYLLERDTERIRRYFIEQGHPFARVEPRLAESPGVVDVTWVVHPGDRRTVTELRTTGLPAGVERPKLRTEAGTSTVARPWVLEGDAERIRRQVCRAGFPDAQVTVAVEPVGSGLAVAFEVVAGRRAVVRAFRVVSPPMPAEVLAGPLPGEGAPWCPDEADALAERLRTRLAAAARPDADVSWTGKRGRPAAAGDAVPVDVTLTITDAEAVRIVRVWFAGNRVTRPDLLRSRVEVEEGDLFDPDAIDRSEQALRRTGLFRRVEARTVPGPRRGTRHLLFQLDEREPFSINLENQSLTLHNLDLGDATTDMRALQAGAALRGAGQRVVLYAQPDWQGLHVFDPYVLSLLGFEARLDRRTAEFGADVEEVWWSAEIAAGLRAFAERVELLPGLWYEASFPEGVPTSAGLPIADEATVMSAFGFRMRMAFERLDEEQVPYLGFALNGSVWRATPWLGGDFDLRRIRADVSVRLPLWRFDGDRHLVLGLLAGAHDLTRYDGAVLPAHSRLTPKIRGFDPLRFDRPLDGDVVELGGSLAATAGVEVRIPMPYARRHALIPFFDAATLADPGVAAVFDELYMAPGLTYAYSFFDERLEGYLRVAFPLRTDVELEYLAFGLGGSF